MPKVPPTRRRGPRSPAPRGSRAAPAGQLREGVPGDLALAQVLADARGELLGVAAVHDGADGGAHHERHEVRQVAHHALHDLLAQFAFELSAERRVDGGGLGGVDAPLLGPGGQIGRRALGEPAGGPQSVHLVQFGDEFEFHGGDAGDLGRQLGGHGRGDREHGGGADAGAHGRGGVRRAGDELVGDLLGAEPGELFAQGRQVADGDPRGEVDQPVGQMTDAGPGAVSAALHALRDAAPDGVDPVGVDLQSVEPAPCGVGEPFDGVEAPGSSCFDGRPVVLPRAPLRGEGCRLRCGDRFERGR